MTRDRGQGLVIAAVVAALGLFAVRLWMGSGTSNPAGEHARGALDTGADAGDADRAPGQRWAATGSGRSGGGQGGSGGPGAGRGPIVIGDGRRGPEQVPDGGYATGARPAGESRADLVDSLPPPEPAAPKPAADEAQPAEREEGLLLSVSSAADLDAADVNSDVQVEEDALTFTDDAQLVFGEGSVRADAGTITFEVEPLWNGTDPTDNSFVQVRNQDQWENRLQIVKNGRYLRFILADDTGRESNISFPIDEWGPGQRHRIAATWGDARIALYVDGQLVGQDTYQGQWSPPDGTPLHVGSDFAGDDYAPAGAKIRGFKVYDRVLADEKIAGRRAVSPSGR